MRYVIAICMSLPSVAATAREPVEGKTVELARLAGAYTAEYSARSGQVPASKSQLQGLTLEVKKDEWIQTYRGDTAVYGIALDVSGDVKEMTLNHKKVKAVRNCTYDLNADTLTVTEQLGDPGEFVVTVWKRTPKTVN